jgi:predicted metal-dependent hydrolase
MLRRSARSRRFSLRVSRLDGRVTLSMPPRAREGEAMAFARAQEGWLRATLVDLPLPEGIRPGDRVPVEGQMLVLRAAEGRLRVEGDSILVPGRAELAALRLQAWMRALARDRLAVAVDRHARALERPVAGITLRDTRTRWGSCTAEGRLMFSWRLVMAPPSVLDYVAAHEVAHLAEMNHSPAFWAVVGQLCPGWRAERDWLRSEGQALHGYRFGD